MGYWSGLALCLTKVRSSRARCPATALILYLVETRVHREYGATENTESKWDGMMSLLAVLMIIACLPLS